MIIRRRLDIQRLLETFTDVASYDEMRKKFYFVFADRNRDGQWTLMNQEGSWSVHGKGEHYTDLCERNLEEEELFTFIWHNRAAINEELRKRNM